MKTIVNGLLKIALFGVAVWAMSFFFEFWIAFGVMSGLYIHELGHLLGMKAYRVANVKGIYFVPFIGAVTVAAHGGKKRPSVDADFFLTIMGPTFGLLSVIGAMIVYVIIGDLVILKIAHLLAWINFLNLLPISILDGGRVMKIIFRSTESLQGRLGLIVGLCTCMFVHVSPILVIPAIICLMRDTDPRRLYAIRPLRRIHIHVAVVWYFFLAIVLLINVLFLK